MTFMRQDNKIFNRTSDEWVTFSSVNKAKRESWAIQMKQDRALGRGSVTVEKADLRR
jgi:hypothetical protein